MTESKRATWREFVEWVRRKRSDKDGELRRAAPEVQTHGEAALVCWFVLGLGRTSAGHLVDEWFGWLRSQGIEPPTEPPNVAQVLEQVATELTRAAKRADSTEEDCHSVGDAIGSAFAEGKTAAYAHAAHTLRAKAKEFT